MIPAQYYWANIALLAVGTFAIRYSLISLSSRVNIPDRTRELFSYIPAAILPALVAPMVFFHNGTVEWVGGKERALVLGLTIVTCALTKSTLATILFGLAALYLVKFT